ncbi:MAG: hypothetical protein ACR652_00430 [Methylocystis sp.]|uniref:hypothetical protein n=1 Tax=Methylocystis sp. TaxID=1911079 RepID=UPI003DA2F9F7
MTLYFPQAVEEMLAGREVRASVGVWFDFLSEEIRVWQGRGAFTDATGNIWNGLGEFGQISGLQGSSMLSIDPVTMTLSGLDPTMMQLVRSQAEEISGRRCGVFFLAFDENWRPIDSPFLAELYLMDKATLSVDGESRTLVISLSAEPLFFSKHIPPVAMVTDADQQRKYPGDTIFKRVPLLNGRQTVYWQW